MAAFEMLCVETSFCMVYAMCFRLWLRDDDMHCNKTIYYIETNELYTMPRIQMLKTSALSIPTVRYFGRASVQNSPGWFNNQKVCGRIVKIILLFSHILKAFNILNESEYCNVNMISGRF